jgi:hypothetical protein
MIGYEILFSILKSVGKFWDTLSLMSISVRISFRGRFFLRQIRTLSYWRIWKLPVRYSLKPFTLRLNSWFSLG